MFRGILMLLLECDNGLIRLALNSDFTKRPVTAILFLAINFRLTSLFDNVRIFTDHGELFEQVLELSFNFEHFSFNNDALMSGVDRTNIIYGALKPTTSNVLYVHGSIDPWHALGLTETGFSQPQPTIYIEGTAHCANMYEPSDKDFPQLKAARVLIVKFIEALLH